MAYRVIQEQTIGGCFNSTARFEDAIMFNRLTPSQQEEMLQGWFYGNGHAEGANNLLALADAVKSFGPENVTSYTILIP